MTPLGPPSLREQVVDVHHLLDGVRRPRLLAVAERRVGDDDVPVLDRGEVELHRLAVDVLDGRARRTGSAAADRAGKCPRAGSAGSRPAGCDVCWAFMVTPLLRCLALTTPCTSTPCSLHTFVMNLTASPTVVTDRAASSSISMPNSSSNIATSSIDCTLSAPRSSVKLFSGWIVLGIESQDPRGHRLDTFFHCRH